MVDERERLLQESAFWEREDIVTKIHAIGILEQKDEYGPLKSIWQPYWDRVELALTHVPAEHRLAALAVFANVVYFDKGSMDAALRTMLYDLQSFYKRWKNRVTFDQRDVHLFAVDHDDLVGACFQDENAKLGFAYRESNKPQKAIKSVTSFINNLHGLTITNELDTVFRKSLWVLLDDNSLSGGSMVSSLIRLRKLAGIAQKAGLNPTIVVGVQLITDRAIAVLRELVDESGIFYGIRLDNRFSISQKECALFGRPDTLRRVRRFCRWFGQTHFPPPPPDAAIEQATVELFVQDNRAAGFSADFRYGWKDCGYTIVTYRNAPTDSVPMLWYPMSQPNRTEGMEQLESAHYVPPFPRVSSRDAREQSSKENERVEYILANEERIVAQLKGGIL